jgi:hypothetical protein
MNFIFTTTIMANQEIHSEKMSCLTAKSVAATSNFTLLIMNTHSVPHAQTPNCWHSHTHTHYLYSDETLSYECRRFMKFIHKLPYNKLHRTVILDTLNRVVVSVTVNAFTGSF